MAGRIGKSAEEKKLRGNPGRRPIEISSSSDKNKKSNMPEMPVDLNQDAKIVWNEIYKDFLELGVIEKVDRIMLEQFCNVVARKRKIQALLDAEDYTVISQSKHGTMMRLRPEYQVLRDCEKEIRTIADQFGLNPLSRKRVISDLQGDLFGDNDTWDQLIH